MHVSRRGFMGVGSLAVLGVRITCAQQRGELRIFVDSAPFLEADEAAGAEERVDWRRSDIRAMNACTQSYAATELHRHIRLLTGKELPIAAPGNGDLAGIYVLSLDNGSLPSVAKAVIAEEKLESRLTISGSFALVPRRVSHRV